MLRTARSATNRITPKGVGCGCGAIFLAIIAAIIALVVQRCVPKAEESASVDPTEEASDSPRLLLGRLWFDKLPTKRTETIDLWIFFGGGIGLHENGSNFRASFDIFEFERQGAKLDGKFLHDKKAIKTTFNVKRCEGHEPFDLCLTLDSFDGKKVELYGFAYDDEMESAVPGSKGTLAAARALGEQGRGGR